MVNTNLSILIGNLTRDPELKFNNAGTAICNFSMAVNGYKEEVSYIKIVAFGKQAENAAKFLAKGKKACVTGRIKTGDYTKEDGSKVYTFEIVANNVEFLSQNKQSRNQIELPGDQYQYNESGMSDIPF